MTNEVIDTIAGESEDLGLHVDLCSQRYAQLIRKFDQVDHSLQTIHTTLIDIQGRLNVEQTSKLRTYLSWAGIVITALLGAVIALVTQ